MTEEKEQRAKREAQSGLPTAHRPLPTDYIELHARSAFSFLQGASTPEDLIGAGAELEMPAMALLDRDGVYGAPRF
ncbi:MAG TPA: PHP domain-containing protein, partial [Pyrinomonadaceae bacterium]|nr:PHP domain-containing protein [Pyrinomonadaceae bacterium]